MSDIVLGTCGPLDWRENSALDDPRDPTAAERVLRLKKVNAVLIARAERMTESQADAYALFQAAILLENQVQKRTQELVAAKRRLEKSNHDISEAKEAAEIANRSKSRFLTAASHDLLQPLNAARLIVSALAETEISAAGAPLVLQLDRALATIGDLIKSVLDIAKLDAGVMVPQIATLDLRALVENVGAEFAPLAAQKNLRLAVIAPAVRIRSDSILLKRILSNLVSNAVRYTRTGGVLIGARRRGAWIRIDVVDTGVGIASEHSAAIFEEFSRGPLQDKDAGEGLGLGLAIVRRIAQALGHELAFRSVEGRGSVFSLLVPIAAAPGHQDGDPAAWPGEWLAGTRLLVIENDPQVVAALAALTTRWHCQMKVARDIESGLALVAASYVPDVIIADYHLDNGLCGLDVIAAVRAAAGRVIPAIVATGDESSAVTADVTEMELPLLRKPLKPAELRALITHFAGREGAGMAAP